MDIWYSQRWPVVELLLSLYLLPYVPPSYYTRVIDYVHTELKVYLTQSATEATDTSIWAPTHGKCHVMYAQGFTCS